MEGGELPTGLPWVSVLPTVGGQSCDYSRRGDDWASASCTIVGRGGWGSGAARIHGGYWVDPIAGTVSDRGSISFPGPRVFVPGQEGPSVPEYLWAAATGWKKDPTGKTPTPFFMVDHHEGTPEVFYTRQPRKWEPLLCGNSRFGNPREGDLKNAGVPQISPVAVKWAQRFSSPGAFWNLGTAGRDISPKGAQMPLGELPKGGALLRPRQWPIMPQGNAPPNFGPGPDLPQVSQGPMALQA